MPVLAVVLKVMLKDAQDSPESISQNPSQKGTGSRLGLRRATGSMDLAWLLRGVSSKPESQARERDAEEATQGQGQQRCSPSQVEVGWTRPFHQSDWSFRRSSRPSQGASHLCRDLAGRPVRGFGLSPESIPPLGRGSRPGIARCSLAPVRGAEACEGDSCLSGTGSEAVWFTN